MKFKCLHWEEGEDVNHNTLNAIFKEYITCY